MLKHWVMPFHSDCVRVSVSGNVHDSAPLNQIKKGDLVIVSDSSPFRLLSFKRENLKWNNVSMPKYEDKVIVDYLHQEILPYEESWTNYNRDIVISLFEANHILLWRYYAESSSL